MTVVEAPPALDVGSTCALVLERVNNALEACGRPVNIKFVGAGLIAYDDCCGMLVVAPERVYRCARFPIEGPDEHGCYDGLIAVALVVLVVRCLPVIDDRGQPPGEAEMGEAYAALLGDAAVVWNELAVWPPEWESTGQAQTFIGAEGGCIGVETRVIIGLDQEVFCPTCP